MKAMVFAAGLGTRLRPLTDSMPKALVKVAGEPLVAHVIRKLVSEGFDDITVNVHHFAPMLEEYLLDNDFGAAIHISDESEELLDTGGGILKAEPFLSGGPFLVHNVDILSSARLASFAARCHKRAMATLLVSYRKTSRYLLFEPETMRLAGWTDLRTGEVRSPYPDIDLSRCIMLAFSGIHYVSDGIFDAFRAEGLEGRFPIMDFYVQFCDKYPIYGIEDPSLTLVDVGKTGSVELAETYLSSM